MKDIKKEQDKRVIERLRAEIMEKEFLLECLEKAYAKEYGEEIIGKHYKEFTRLANAKSGSILLIEGPLSMSMLIGIDFTIEDKVVKVDHQRYIKTFPYENDSAIIYIFDETLHEIKVSVIYKGEHNEPVKISSSN